MKARQRKRLATVIATDPAWEAMKAARRNLQLDALGQFKS
jgi:hypothetical protein